MHLGQLSALCLIAVFALAGCSHLDDLGDPTERRDASVVAMGGLDGGLRDGGLPDAGPRDGGGDASNLRATPPILIATGDPASRFDYSPGSIVLDRSTNLVWQRQLPGPSSCPGGTASDTALCTWEQANAYCDALELYGYDDWQLPEASELSTLLDPTSAPVRIDERTFPGTPAIGFWTTDLVAYDRDRRVSTFSGVSFSALDGTSVGTYEGGRRLGVRCFRSSTQ